MDTFRILLLAACVGFVAAAPAEAAAYDLLVVACRDSTCRRVAEQSIDARTANQTEYSYGGLRLLIETLGRSANEEDARLSVNIHATDETASAWRSTPAAWVQGLEALVVQCKFKSGMFSPLTTFVRDGTIYQIWGRLAAMH